jgi:hypothetical protein
MSNIIKIYLFKNNYVITMSHEKENAFDALLN